MTNQQIMKMRTEVDILTSSLKEKTTSKHDATIRIIKLFTDLFDEERQVIIQSIIDNILSVPATQSGESTYRDKLISKIKEYSKI